MSRVLILVEGPTERAIVHQVFTPELAMRGVYVYPRIVGKPGRKGGNKFAAVRRELKALIRQENESTVTMLFDYYGLRDDWPGLAKAKGKRPDEIPVIMEPAIAQAMADEMGPDFNRDRFIPYVQLFEIESLLFAGPAEMARVFQRPELELTFATIVAECGGCERINDDPETAPSKRIKALFPEYKKGSGVNAHAYRIARHIGLKRMREKCPHFNEWLSQLERLASPAQPTTG